MGMDQGLIAQALVAWGPTNRQYTAGVGWSLWIVGRWLNFS